MTEQEMRERLDNGLCIKCGKPIQDKRGICQECFDNLSQTDKTYLSVLWFFFEINDKQGEEIMPENEVAKQNLQKKLDKYGAKITPFMTTEKLVDEIGNIHYVDYSPIDFKKIFDNEKVVKQ